MDISPQQARDGNRSWWDAEAADYQAEFYDRLGRSHFSWGPEGLEESHAHFLGSLAELRASATPVLEVGCGAAQCTRWLRDQGVHAIGLDLSVQQLRQSRLLDEVGEPPTPVIAASADALPLATGSASVAFSSYGALQFVTNTRQVFEEVHRVVQPGGKWVFSVTHPIRWAFPDDGSSRGLTAFRSYFDETPYVEYDTDGHVSYLEQHRTMGSWVELIVSTGFSLVGLTEPEWSDPNRPDWGPWSAQRGRIIPGTAIFQTIRR